MALYTNLHISIITDKSIKTCNICQPNNVPHRTSPPPNLKHVSPHVSSHFLFQEFARRNTHTHITTKEILKKFRKNRKQSEIVRKTKKLETKRQQAGNKVTMKKTMNKEEEINNESQEEEGVPLLALNHVSRLCRDVKESIGFYRKVMGMVLIERPAALDFEGAWLFNYGIGIHLVHAKDDDRLPDKHRRLDPMDNHISFQCEDMEAMEKRLTEQNVKYMKRTLEDDENGTKIDQLFFDDPDGFMIEICNCENLELVPAGSLGQIRLPVGRHSPPLHFS